MVNLIDNEGSEEKEETVTLPTHSLVYRHRLSPQDYHFEAP